MVSLTFLSGPIMNTERTVALSSALGWIMSYAMATFRSESAMIGKFMVQDWVSLMSLIQRWCDSSGSTLMAITFALRLANSPLIFATVPSSVVQTGVKSEGWEKS